MKREVRKYVKICEKWQMKKLIRPRRKAPMEITTTASQPTEECAFATAGPLVEILYTSQDDLS
jgi:hypothetical protein